MLYKGMKPSENYNRKMDFANVLFMILRKAIDIAIDKAIAI